MANELEFLTINAAGNSWVDSVPDDVSTGYQAQNINIESGRNGIDLSAISWDGGTSEIVVSPAGPIDLSGDLIEVKSEVRLTIASTNTWYIEVIPGATSTTYSLQLTTSRGTFDETKNGYYNGANRILNWIIAKTSAATPLIYRENGQYQGGAYIEELLVGTRVNQGFGQKLHVAGSMSLTGDQIFNLDHFRLISATSDGSDNQRVSLCGGGSASPDRGAQVKLFGNEYASNAGKLFLYAGNVPGANVEIGTGNTISRISVDYSGRIRFGATLPTDDGVTDFQFNGSSKFAGSMSLTGDIIFTSGDRVVRNSVNTGRIAIAGGDNSTSSSGAYALFHGNNRSGNPGFLRLFPGNASGAVIDLVGRTLVNSPTDDGSSALQVNGSVSFNGDLTLGTGSADRTITFASGFSLLADVSEDEFVFSKPVRKPFESNLTSTSVINYTDLQNTSPYGNGFNISTTTIILDTSGSGVGLDDIYLVVAQNSTAIHVAICNLSIGVTTPIVSTGGSLISCSSSGITVTTSTTTETSYIKLGLRHDV